MIKGIIKQIAKKIKSTFKFFIDFLGKDIVFYSLLIIFLSSISFFLGSLSEYNREREVKKDSIELFHQNEKKKIYYVASKKGKRYYLPWCYSGSDKNKIIFKTKKEAEEKGYTPSKSCEGL